MIARRSLSPGLRVALVSSAVLLAILAQAWLDKRSAVAAAWLLYAVAASFFAVGARPLAGWRQSSQSPDFPRKGLLLAGLVLCIPAYVGFADNQWRWWSLTCWLLAMSLCVSACWPSAPAPPQGWQRLRQRLAQASWLLAWPRVALIMALLVGMALRFYQLHDLPADLGWDLPYNYFDAQRILGGERLIFFADNYGREGAFFYLIAAVSRWIGLSPYSIRVTSALIGVATIVAVYGLGRACYNDEVAAYAAWGMALSRWDLTLSRSGYRVSLMPLVSALALIALARLLRRGRAIDWAITGLCLGLGLMTYKAFTFAVVTVVGLAGLFMLQNLRRVQRHGGARRNHVLGFAVMLALLCVAALPMLRFVIDTPDLYFARELHGGDLVASSIERERISPLHLYADNLVTSLGMFNHVGDANPRFGVPLQRHLGFATGVAFVLGAVLAIKRLTVGASGMLLASVLGLMLPMTVSLLAGESPNCFRSSGVIGPCLVLGAAALAAVRRQMFAFCADRRIQPLFVVLSVVSGGTATTRRLCLRWGALLTALLWLAIGMAGLGEGVETARDYFVDFRHVAPDMENYSVARELADRIIRFDDGPAYIKVWPYWYDGRAVQEHVSTAGRRWDGEYLGLDLEQPPLQDYRGRLLILLHPQDEATLLALEQGLKQSVVIMDDYPSGEPSLVALYGER